MRIEGMDAAFISNVGQNRSETDLPVKLNIPAQEQEQKHFDVNLPFIRKAVEKANNAMKIHRSSLEFQIHEKTNDIIVRIIDMETNEVIREIPSEKILDMFANMLELAGLLVDERR